jgi:predicted RNA-binding Zn-ribbon protein involved in translation (DUF1610 family)
MFEDCALCLSKSQPVVRTPTNNEVGYYISYDCPNCGKYISDDKTNKKLTGLNPNDKDSVVKWIKKTNQIQDLNKIKPDLRKGWKLDSE